MVKKIKKAICLSCLCLMITGHVRTANALIPLPTIDFGRIGEVVSQISHSVTSIQNEVKRNMLIVQEIQNGGFGAAAGMLFANIENGKYGSFLGDLNALKGTWAEEAINRKFKQEEEERCSIAAETARDEMREHMASECPTDGGVEEYNKCMELAKISIEEAGNKSRKECSLAVNKEKAKAIEEMKAEIERQNKKLLAGEKYIPESGDVKFSNVYSWIQGGNVSGIINSATNGDASDIIGTIGQSAADTYGNIAGDDDVSNIISGASGIVGGGVDVLGGDGNIIDKVNDASNNSSINSGWKKINKGGSSAENSDAENPDAEDTNNNTGNNTNNKNKSSSKDGNGSSNGVVDSGKSK